MWFCVSLLGTCLVPPELGRLGLRKLILGTCLLVTFQGNASGWLGSCLNLRWPLALSGNAQKSKREDVMKKRFTLISAVLAFIAWLNLPTLSSADCGSHFSATVTNQADKFSIGVISPLHSQQVEDLVREDLSRSLSPTFPPPLPGARSRDANGTTIPPIARASARQGSGRPAYSLKK